MSRYQQKEPGQAEGTQGRVGEQDSVTLSVTGSWKVQKVPTKGLERQYGEWAHQGLR